MSTTTPVRTLTVGSQLLAIAKARRDSFIGSQDAASDILWRGALEPKAESICRDTIVLSRARSLALRELDIYTDPVRRSQIQGAIESVADALSHPGHLRRPGKDFAQQFLSETTLERLQSFHDLLQREGRSHNVETARIEGVIADIEDVLNEIGTSPETDLDDFIVRYFRDLRVALLRLEECGREGAEDIIAEFSGKSGLRQGSLSQSAIAMVGRGIQIAKTILDVFVYTHSAVSAVDYAQQRLLSAPQR